MEENESRYGRGRFLRQIGLTLAAAVGAGALASNAYATLNCCPARPENNCPTCPQGNKFYCVCTGISENYCICASGTDCYSGPC